MNRLKNFVMVIYVYTGKGNTHKSPDLLIGRGKLLDLFAYKRRSTTWFQRNLLNLIADIDSIGEVAEDVVDLLLVLSICEETRTTSTSNRDSLTHQ